MVIIKKDSGKTKSININRLRKFWEQDTSDEGEAHDLEQSDAESSSEEDASDEEDANPEVEKLIKTPNPSADPQGPMTRSRAKLINQTQQINLISHQELGKLRSIAKKVFRNNADFKPETLTSEELQFWRRFDKSEVFELLTGRAHHAPDFHEYIQCYWPRTPGPIFVYNPADFPALPSPGSSGVGSSDSRSTGNTWTASEGSSRHHSPLS